MIGKQLSRLLKLDTKHSLYREDGGWYHQLKKFPGVLFDKNGYLVFKSESDYIHHPGLQRKNDLHINGGIQSLNGYQLFSDSEKMLVENSGILIEKESLELVIRARRVVEQLIRKKKLVDRVKKIYNNTCQICGVRLMLQKGVFYSEVHHIKPLGAPHNGPDCLDNMICVCPNHHVVLDFKTIRLVVGNLYISLHNLSSDYIDYHNGLVKNG